VTRSLLTFRHLLQLDYRLHATGASLIFSFAKSLTPDLFMHSVLRERCSTHKDAYFTPGNLNYWSPYQATLPLASGWNAVVLILRCLLYNRATPCSKLLLLAPLYGDSLGIPFSTRGFFVSDLSRPKDLFNCNPNLLKNDFPLRGSPPQLSQLLICVVLLVFFSLLIRARTTFVLLLAFCFSGGGCSVI